MLNNAVLVGRIVSDPQINETKDSVNVSNITLAVTRSYKNVDGVYDTDLIPVVLWKQIAINTCEYCKKGDLVGIKGHIQMRDNKIEIVAEKVTFLSSKAPTEE